MLWFRFVGGDCGGVTGVCKVERWGVGGYYCLHGVSYQWRTHGEHPLLRMGQGLGYSEWLRRVVRVCCHGGWFGVHLCGC